MYKIMITKLRKLTSSQINHISPIETVSSQLLPYEPRYDRYKPALLLAQFPANLSGVISMLDADSSRFPRKKDRFKRHQIQFPGSGKRK